MSGSRAIHGKPVARFNAVGSRRKRLRNVAVLFADVEGCTRLCEDLPPKEMNRLLERYFSRFLDVVQSAGGEITEILGDGLVALFEGPSVKENADRALVAAVRIQRAVEELNREERRRHDPIVVNMGLNAGPALVGTMRLRGRMGERRVYSATGPVTNIAARLCGRGTRGQILIPGEMTRMLGRLRRARRVGRLKLKNVSVPVQVFELLPAAGKWSVE